MTVSLSAFVLPPSLTSLDRLPPESVVSELCLNSLPCLSRSVMDQLSSRIAQLERMLMEKLTGGADKQEAAGDHRDGDPTDPLVNEAPNAEESAKEAQGLKEEAALIIKAAPPHQAASAVDPATACAVSAISVSPPLEFILCFFTNHWMVLFHAKAVICFSFPRRSTWRPSQRVQL